MIGSRPAEGSSRNRIAGSSAIARAIAARFCMPPESSAGRCPRERLEPDQLELHARDQVDRVVGQIGVYSSSGRRTFSSSVIEPNSAPDWYITPIRRRIDRSVLALGGDDVVAVDEDVPGHRVIEPDHVLQQRALAAARAAEDHEDLAAPDLEVDVLQNGHALVAGGEVLDADDDVFAHAVSPSALRAIPQGGRFALGAARRAHMSSR